MNAEKEAKKHGIKISFIYLNCKINKTLFTLIRGIAERINIPFLTKGLSTEELMNRILDYVYDKNIRLILALDEFDFLVKEEGSEAVYFLTRIGEVRNEKSIMPSLICILRNPEVLRNLDESSRSSLQSNFIHLKEYNEEQLYGIIKYRASEAFYENSVLDETLKFIAEISSERRDARYAIELLWRAGKFAEAENSKMVLPEHVRKAHASIYPAINKEYLKYLNIHEKLILLAFSKYIKENKKSYVAPIELYDFYINVCEEHNIEPRSYRIFLEYLQKIEDIGYIRIDVLNRKIKGEKSYFSLLEKELLNII
jgi:cell division control protein 6